MPPVIPAVSPDVFERIAAQFQAEHAVRSLTVHQIDGARLLALSEQPVESVVSIPGTGRAVLLEVLSRAVRASGGRIIGLGPSLVSADHLAQQLDGAPTFTVAHWLDGRRQARNGDGTAAFALGPGDVLFLSDVEVLADQQREQLLHDAAGHGALVRFTTGG